MKAPRIQITDFSFMPSGNGHYRVTYTSPVTFKSWSITTSEMRLIDATKGADYPKRKDLEQLKWICKNPRQMW